jgi:hypothetical protein
MNAKSRRSNARAGNLVFSTGYDHVPDIETYVVLIDKERDEVVLFAADVCEANLVEVQKKVRSYKISSQLPTGMTVAGWCLPEGCHVANWDGYGALPISPEVERNAKALWSMFQTSPVPNANGTLSFEADGAAIEIGKTRIAGYFGDEENRMFIDGELRAAGRVAEGPGVQAEFVLLAWSLAEQVVQGTSPDAKREDAWRIINSEQVKQLKALRAAQREKT